ncbi:MAG: type II toxin-antitoxin system death-on-curing family toxin [Chloroflexi bacterium]|nr:type II toxin-antitoxin system death-on-curing family toxin [Chloroflexota bacterium]
MTRYLTADEVLVINEEILGGEARPRDRGLLESAVARPMASAFGEDAYPSLFEKAAALLDSLSRNHPFVDGNKRTATIALDQFLRKNGLRPTWNPVNALQFILAVAQGQRTITEIAEWLANNTEPITPPE